MKDNLVSLLLILPLIWVAYMVAPSCEGLTGMKFALTAKPDWKRHDSPKFGLSLESPYEVKWEVKERKDRSGESSESLFGLTPVNLSGFLLTASSRTSFDPDKPLDSKTLLEGFTKTLQESGFREPAWKTRPVTCSGLPATLVTGSYYMGSSPRYFQYLQVVKNGRAWTVEANQRTPDEDGTSLKRVMDSVKVSP